MKLYVVPIYQYDPYYPSHIRNPIRVEGIFRYCSRYLTSTLDYPKSELLYRDSSMDAEDYFKLNITKEDVIKEVKLFYPKARVASYLTKSPEPIRSFLKGHYGWRSNVPFWHRVLYKKLSNLGFDVKFKFLTKSYEWL